MVKLERPYTHPHKERARTYSPHPDITHGDCGCHSGAGCKRFRLCGIPGSRERQRHANSAALLVQITVTRCHWRAVRALREPLMPASGKGSSPTCPLWCWGMQSAGKTIPRCRLGAVLCKGRPLPNGFRLHRCSSSNSRPSSRCLSASLPSV